MIQRGRNPPEISSRKPRQLTSVTGGVLIGGLPYTLRPEAQPGLRGRSARFRNLTIRGLTRSFLARYPKLSAEEPASNGNDLCSPELSDRATSPGCSSPRKAPSPRGAFLLNLFYRSRDRCLLGNFRAQFQRSAPERTYSARSGAAAILMRPHWPKRPRPCGSGKYPLMGGRRLCRPSSTTQAFHLRCRPIILDPGCSHSDSICSQRTNRNRANRHDANPNEALPSEATAPAGGRRFQFRQFKDQEPDPRSPSPRGLPTLRVNVRAGLEAQSAALHAYGYASFETK